jgi:hypothetical protein
MPEPFLNSGWTNFLVAACFLCLLLFVFFRLDAHLSGPRRRHQPSPAAGIDKKGRHFLTDPDGRRWYPTSRVK